jgi:hypothetical protein
MELVAGKKLRAKLDLIRQVISITTYFYCLFEYIIFENLRQPSMAWVQIGQTPVANLSARKMGKP